MTSQGQGQGQPAVSLQPLPQASPYYNATAAAAAMAYGMSINQLSSASPIPDRYAPPLKSINNINSLVSHYSPT